MHHFISLVFLSLGMILFSAPSMAEAIKMLPPQLRNESACVKDTGKPVLLAWDGATSLRCVNTLKITKYTDAASDLTITGNAAITGNTTISGSSAVTGNSTVSGTTNAVGGFILPKVIPAAPAKGQMWLVP